jgi:hypothetical protein
VGDRGDTFLLEFFDLVVDLFAKYWQTQTLALQKIQRQQSLNQHPT